MEDREGEHQLDHFLQGHYEPEVAAKVRRAINLGQITIDQFILVDGFAHENLETMDDRLLGEERQDGVDRRWISS